MVCVYVCGVRDLVVCVDSVCVRVGCGVWCVWVCVWCGVCKVSCVCGPVFVMWVV